MTSVGGWGGEHAFESAIVWQYTCTQAFAWRAVSAIGVRNAVAKMTTMAMAPSAICVASTQAVKEKTMMTLMKIVQDENLKALEHFCQSRTYQQVRQRAIDEGVDLDALEELLVRI